MRRLTISIGAVAALLLLSGCVAGGGAYSGGYGYGGVGVQSYRGYGPGPGAYYRGNVYRGNYGFRGGRGRPFGRGYY